MYLGSEAKRATYLASIPELPGLNLEGELGRGAHSVVYRATRDGHPFAVKIARPQEGMSKDTLVLRFRREAAVLACLRHAGLAEVVEVGEVGGLPYLVQELVVGRTLASQLAERPLTQTEAVALARTLAGALAEVHRHHLVHRDVTPHNVLIDEQHQPRLIDFGLATRVSTAELPREMAGTFRYSAPEQTGMIKRPLDGRADLYSLGVVLYECLSGCLPFESPDVAELIRQHAAVPPPELQPLCPDTSPALVALVHKLLAKDPDDRYLSGESLLADLEQLDALDLQHRAGTPLALGRDGRAPADVPLLGRESELDRLVERWERVRKGKGSIVIVEGQPGSGKSRLLRELRDCPEVADGGALVLQARCSEGNPMPFAALREAVRPHLRAAIGASHDADGARGVHEVEHLRQAAGASAPLLRRFLPELAAILGEAAQATLEEGAGEGQDPFYEAVTELVLGLARSDRPLLLVLDDVQWLDDASHQVLRRVASRASERAVLLAVTARNDDASRPGLERFIETVSVGPSERVGLRALDLHSVGQLMSAHLGGRPVDTELVAELIRRTGGNPFAVGEYTRAMLDAGILQPRWGQWTIDHESLARLQLPTNVLELVLRRVAALPEQTTAVLRYGAMIGARFELSLLVSLCEGDDARVQDALSEALRLHLIGRQGSDYAFIHDQVREAFVSAPDEATRRQMHQRIAETLDALPPDDPARDPYRLAHHYAHGDTARDPKRVYETTREAGERALKDYAHQEACTLFEHAFSAHSHSGLAPDASFHAAFGEASARTTRLDQAEMHLRRALELSTDGLQRARVRAALARAYLNIRTTAPGWQEVLAALADLRAPYHRSPVVQIIVLLWSWMLGWLGLRFGFRFGTARGREREALTIQCRLYEIGAILANMNQRSRDVLYIGGRWFAAGHRLGESRELVVLYGYFGVLWSILGSLPRAASYADRAVAMAQRLGDPLVLARVTFLSAMARHWGGDARTAEKEAQRALEEHGRMLVPWDYTGCANDLACNLLVRGYAEQASRWARLATDSSGSLVGPEAGKKYRRGCDYHVSTLAMLGRLHEATPWVEISVKNGLGECSGDPYMCGHSIAHRIAFYLEQGELGEPLERDLQTFADLGFSPRRVTYYLRVFYLFQAYARAEQVLQAQAAERPAAIARLRQAAAELRQAARVPALRGHLHVIDGVLAWLDERPARARAYFQQAETLADEVDSPWVCYEARRFRAHLLRAEGHPEAACRQASIALQIAKAHRWAPRAQRLSERFGLESELERLTTSVRSASGSQAGSYDPQTVKVQRHLDALMQVSLAAATVLDPERQARAALDEIARLLGAERACLFLSDPEGALQLAAAWKGEPQSDDDEGTSAQYSSTAVEHVRTTREPLISAGSDDGALLGSQSVMALDIRSIMAAPLLLRDELVGVVYLDSRMAKGVFTADDLTILRAIANHIAVAMETARAAQLEVERVAQSRQLEQQSLLLEISQCASASLDLALILRDVARMTAKACRAARCTIFLISEQRQLEPAVAQTAAGDIPAELWQEIRTLAALPLDDVPLLEQSARDHKAHGISLLREPAALPAAWNKLFGLELVAVPLVARRHAVALLLLQRERPGDAFTAGQTDLARTIGGLVAAAIENAQLFGEIQRLATTDGLTGLHNRRHLFALARKELARMRRYGHRPGLLLFDIDHFKRVNDTHGHAIGDEVLREVARRCRTVLREVDILGRYGGEEFVAFLPETGDPPNCRTVAERLRRAIADPPIPTTAGALPITVSIGIAPRAPQTVDLETLLKGADDALYRAKARGRNRVEEHSPEPHDQEEGV